MKSDMNKNITKMERQPKVISVSLHDWLAKTSLPKPYYKDENTILFCADCTRILPLIPANSVDLVLTDPPYNVGINYGEETNDNKSKEEFIEWARKWFIECRRISGTVLICGQGRLPDYAKIEDWKWLLAWWKPASMGRSPVGFCNFEPVAMWGKGTSKSVDVILAPIIPDVSIDGHPCPKPLGWGEGFISIFPDAEIILDPFAGSGTTLVAAKRLNRKAIGIEISKEYCKIAVNRLSQQELFNNPDPSGSPTIACKCIKNITNDKTKKLLDFF